MEFRNCKTLLLLLRLYLNTFSIAFEKKQRIFLAKWEEQGVPNYVIINVRLLSHSLSSLLQQQRNRTNKISSEMDGAAIIQLYKTFFAMILLNHRVHKHKNRNKELVSSYWHGWYKSSLFVIHYQQLTGRYHKNNFF